MKKNILAENMRRFGTKNLNEADLSQYSKDNKNYQPSIEVVNKKHDSSGYPTLTVKIDGGKPLEIEFDDYEVVDSHGYENDVWLMGTDENDVKWGMEGSMAFHGDVEDYDIDTLESDEDQQVYPLSTKNYFLHRNLDQAKKYRK